MDVRAFLNKIFTLLLVTLGFASLAGAKEYPHRGNTDIIYLNDTGVDLDVRFDLVSQATSIDFVGYSQNLDAYGEPFLKAVREAQLKNSAKVRFLYDRMVSVQNKDFTNDVKAVISDPSLACRGEALCAHPLEKLSSGVGLFDYVHEKILILNRGTPLEMMIIGFGRGHTGDSAGWVDSSIIVRPIDRTKPYLGDDIQSIFDSLYGAMKKMSENSVYKIPTQLERGSKLNDAEARPHFAKSKADKDRVEEILALVNHPASSEEATALKSYQFRPNEITAMSNELYAQLISPTRPQERGDFVNDNQRNLNAEIRNFTGKIELTSYGVGPTTATHEALVDFIQRGNTLEIYTNGAEAFKAAYGQPHLASYAFESLARLIRDTKGMRGKLIVHVLNPTRNPGVDKSPYLHRRMVVFSSESGPRFTYMGSDPMTWSSAYKNDECMFKVDDPRFAGFMHDVSESEKDDYDLLTHDEVLRLDANRPFLYRCLRMFIKIIL